MTGAPDVLPREAQQRAARPADGRWPGVSVVVPVLDEERHLTAAVTRILGQEYPGDLDVVLAVAPSRDRTREIADGLAARDPRVRVVDNPTGRTPAGLNAAIGASTHEVVVRVDGHGMLPPGYVLRAVQTLLATGAANVGGMMVPEGRTPFESAVAWAMSSRWGIGGGRFHVGGSAGPVDSVYLGVFRRDVIDAIGGFDEAFHRAQDWELNHRIREAGGTVWFTPDLTVSYRPRSTPRALARQFFTTGQWRRQVMQRYPDTVSPRYLAPPAATAAVGAGALVGTVGALVGPKALLLGWAAPAGYSLAVLAATAASARGLGPAAVLRVPVVLATMHLCWGAGFLRGAPGARRQWRPRAR